MEWLEKAKCKALADAVPYDGDAWEYDYNSFYPYILSSGFMIPLKKGTFKHITQQEFDDSKEIKFGIYKCNVEPSEDKSINRLFVFKFTPYYEHYDLMTARKLGLKVIISPDDCNMLAWERKDCMKGSIIFGEYVSLLFKLKQQKIDGAKQILTILWGALSQKNDVVICIDNDSKKIIDLENASIRQIFPRNSKQTIIKYIKNNYFYETNWARICPFLLSRGRNYLASTMLPHIQSIVRYHTDGFLSTKQLDLGSKIGLDLGQIKQTYHPRVVIKNRNNIDKYELVDGQLSKVQRKF
jgi:hypothetical protein